MYTKDITLENTKKAKYDAHDKHASAQCVNLWTPRDVLGKAITAAHKL